MSSALQDLPEAIVLGLSGFVESATAIYGSDLKSVVLFGSGAEGRLSAASDINLILVLTSFDSGKADAMRGPFAAAQAAIKLGLCSSSNLNFSRRSFRSVRNFPTSFADIESCTVPIRLRRPAVILRLKQVLLNLMLRLREGYVDRGSAPERISALIAEAAGPLRSCAATLLELKGKPVAARRSHA